VSDDVVMIGSEGYLGTAMRALVPRFNWGFECIDQKLGHDITTMDPAQFKDRTVLYLASYHECALEEEAANESAYYELMVKAPVAIAQHARSLVYVSSMRAITDRHRLYGYTKAEAERQLVRTRSAKVIRIGTIWGGFGRMKVPTHTAINYAISSGQFLGDHWESFTTNLDTLTWELERLLMRPEPHCVVTDTFAMVTANDVRALLAGKSKFGSMQAHFNIERDRAKNAAV
jgi:hypothetical protein